MGYSASARSRLFLTTALIGLSLPVTGVAAQVVSQEAATADPASVRAEGVAPASPDDIVVTGTLVRNPNVVASSPVSVISDSELRLRNVVNAEQAIRDIPGAVAGQGGQVNNGNNGFGTANLRGLGEQRNLILLDGDRLVTANQLGTVDLNNIPLALVRRTDVLTGGASTTYGADAVSGVINFITRTDFDGAELSASQRITERGDASFSRVDAVLGKNFAGGRGNIVLNVGYQKADPLYLDGRDFSRVTIGGTTGFAGGTSPASVPTSLGFASGIRQVSPDGQSLQAVYQPFDFAPFTIFQTPYERVNVYGAAKYDVSDSIEIYGRGMYSNNHVSVITAPSGVFGEPLTIPANNPYLSPAIRNEICTRNGIALGATCNGNQALPLTVYRRGLEVGPRTSEYVTSFYDFKAGVRLKLSEATRLDVSGAYGKSRLDQNTDGFVFRSRLQQGLNATNTTTCIDPSNGCVPLNLFGGAGSLTPAQVAFISIPSTIAINNELSQVKALLSGDVKGLALVDGNAPSYAIGAEYRKYDYARRPDSFAQIPGELGGSGGAVPPFSGSYDVREAYGELIVPLLADRSFFHSLTFETGLRYSNYKIDAANSPGFDAWTYKAGGSWEPVDGLKLRGNYQRAVRAPNIAELFSPVTPRLANQSSDPCVGAAPIGNAALTAVCLAQGAPAASIGLILPPSNGQANVTGGGDPNIQPEKADTFTIGAVVQPRNILPGFTLTVDYYDIDVSNAIARATPGDVLVGCFGSNPAAISAAQATSPACTIIRRNPSTGRLSGSQATTLGLPAPLTNLGRLQTNGIDLTANYQRQIGAVALALSFVGNWTEKNVFQAAPSAYARDCAGYYSVNCISIQPNFSWNQRTTIGIEGVDVSLLWRHLGAQTYEGVADDAVARGVRPAFSGVITGTSPLTGGRYDFNRIKPYNYFDLAVRVSPTPKMELTFSANNLFDRTPPIVGNGIGDTGLNAGNTLPSTYDTFGRTFNVTARLEL